MIISTNTKWRKVSKDSPCPVCQKPDWCLKSLDGNAAICARIQSNKPAGYKGAGWIHHLNGIPLPLPPQTETSSKSYPRTSILRRDFVYKAFLKELSLSDIHIEHLIKRGLTDLQITDLGYKTLPKESDGRNTAIRRLVSNNIHMAGVPGFYFKNGEIKLCGTPGMLIPIRDIQKRILGLQVRADHCVAGKYRWISSLGKLFGCGSGAPVHVSHPEYADREIWITEGALKADIAATKMQRCMLAVAGVGNWSGVIPIVQELHPKRVIIAFDMDKISNQVVKLHSEALIVCLLKFGLRTFEADWNTEFKGIDDLVTAGDQ